MSSRENPRVWGLAYIGVLVFQVNLGGAPPPGCVAPSNVDLVMCVYSP